eukprot:8557248-Ditylum_brightwellii.AAC.1
MEAVTHASSAVTSSSPIALSQFANNAHLVGPAWVISSAILTTYSTTSFLKHGELNGREGGGGRIQTTRASNLLDESRRRGRIVSDVASIPRTTLLTLYRFSGSLLLGLTVQYKPWRVASRIKETWLAAQHF